MEDLMSELSPTKLSSEELIEITKRCKKNDFFDFEFNDIKVLGKFSNIYHVDVVNGKSTSSGGDNCYYLRLLVNILRNQKSQWEWFIVSQFHKELRRGCIDRAISAGNWLAYIRNNSGVRQYVQSIILEETRSTDLLDYIDSEKNWRKCVIKFCNAKKKWELSTFADGRKIFYDECTNQKIYLDLSDVDKTIEYVERITKYDEMYRAFARLQIERIKGKNEQVNTVLEEWFKSLIMSVDKKYKDSLMKYCGWKMSSWNNFESVLNISDNDKLINVETGVIHPKEAVTFDFAFFPDYAIDNHVFQGKKLFKKELDIIKSKDHDKLTIDLRWSGITLGEFWRTKGYELFGADLCKKKWTDVIPSDDWDKILTAESLTSGTF
jgi:hypothetical protein